MSGVWKYSPITDFCVLRDGPFALNLRCSQHSSTINKTIFYMRCKVSHKSNGLNIKIMIDWSKRKHKNVITCHDSTEDMYQDHNK